MSYKLRTVCERSNICGSKNYNSVAKFICVLTYRIYNSRGLTANSIGTLLFIFLHAAFVRKRVTVFHRTQPYTEYMEETAGLINNGQVADSWFHCVLCQSMYKGGSLEVVDHFHEHDLAQTLWRTLLGRRFFVYLTTTVYMHRYRAIPRHTA